MIRVTYRFPAGSDTNKMAQVIAIGQTVGSWGAEFSHRADQMAAHTAEVIATDSDEQGRGYATIGFPTANIENDIPSLLTMIFGKFSLAGPARIVAIELPENFGLSAKFGIDGIRQLTGVTDRPLFMGIFKPALGLSAADHAQLLTLVSQAGLDIIKDDEINFNLAAAPTLERVKACAPVMREREQQLGRPILYAVNLSGRNNELIDNARRLIDAGANALLLNVLCYGFGVLESLARHPDIRVPIFAHPALAGAFGGSTLGDSDYGIDYPVQLGTLMRFGGADGVLYPAHYGSLPFTAEMEFSIRDELRKTLPQHKASLPVPSAGVHPGIVAKALADYGEDVCLNAGSAIFDHPLGARAGTQAFFDAYKLVQSGQPLTLANADTEALTTALQKWGEVH